MSAPKASLGPQACSTACSRHLAQAPLVGSPTLVLLPTPRRLGSGRRSAPLLLACHFARRRLPEGSSPDLRSKLFCGPFAGASVARSLSAVAFFSAEFVSKKIPVPADAVRTDAMKTRKINESRVGPG